MAAAPIAAFLAANAGAIAAGAGAVSAGTSLYGMKRSHDAQQNAAEARKRAEVNAANRANSRIALGRQAMRDNNLLTDPNGGGNNTLGSA